MGWRKGRVFKREKARMGQDNFSHICHLLHICTSAIAASLPLPHQLQDSVGKPGRHIKTVWESSCWWLQLPTISISGNMVLMAARTELWVPSRPCQFTLHTNQDECLQPSWCSYRVSIFCTLWAAAVGISAVKSNRTGFPHTCRVTLNKSVYFWASVSFTSKIRLILTLTPPQVYMWKEFANCSMKNF